MSIPTSCDRHSDSSRATPLSKGFMSMRRHMGYHSRQLDLGVPLLHTWRNFKSGVPVCRLQHQGALMWFLTQWEAMHSMKPSNVCDGGHMFFSSDLPAVTFPRWLFAWSSSVNCTFLSWKDATRPAGSSLWSVHFLGRPIRPHHTGHSCSTETLLRRNQVCHIRMMAWLPRYLLSKAIWEWNLIVAFVPGGSEHSSCQKSDLARHLLGILPSSEP